VHEVGAPEAEMDLGVVAEVNHPVREVVRSAAPALDGPVAILLTGGGDGFGSHGSSVPLSRRWWRESVRCGEDRPKGDSQDGPAS